MFETHKLNEQGFEKMKEFKTKMSLVCSEAMEMMHDPRSKAQFKTAVEEAVFLGARGIASNPENHSEIINYPEFNGTNGLKA